MRAIVASAAVFDFLDATMLPRLCGASLIRGVQINSQFASEKVPHRAWNAKADKLTSEPARHFAPIGAAVGNKRVIILRHEWRPGSREPLLKFYHRLST
jgi:hypothetical protein